MRQKAEFQLFKRPSLNGKTTWYYYTYDTTGTRVRRSTGQSTKTAALAYVHSRLKNGELGLSKSENFGRWSESWWIWDECKYIQSQRGRISRSHADVQRSYLVKHIVPYFGKYLLENITPGLIENWIAKLQTTCLAASSINHCLTTLKVMLNEAERLELIARNPARTVRKLPEVRPNKGILTVEEASQLFSPDNYEPYWHGNNIHYAINLVAASTGLRMGEIQGLEVSNVQKGYLQVEQSWTRKYGLVGDRNTKKHRRVVPIPQKTEHCIREMSDLQKEGFIFTLNGTSPLDNRSISSFYYATLGRMGIDRRERNITFHSWRHWFNTVMRARYISDAKLRQITGHRTEEMTERYTSFDLTHYQDVVDVQESIF